VEAALAAYWQTARLELRDSQLQAELAWAQLEALRLEIRPHFLFNTLNAIAALIRRGANDQALEMLLGLGDLMRTTLDRAGEHVVALGTEIEFTRRYVELQRARFSDRLDVAYDVDESCSDVPVPTFLLQPLVENALHHGIARTAGRCRMEIGARLEDGRLRVWVTDSGAGLPSGFTVKEHARTGLGNIRARLDRLYGAAAQFDVTAASPGGTTARVVLPCERHAAAAGVSA
jgi:LytS/YehU family sensor histidine kinase